LIDKDCVAVVMDVSRHRYTLASAISKWQIPTHIVGYSLTQCARAINCPPNSSACRDGGNENAGGMLRL
jgi:hypothetical protein